MKLRQAFVLLSLLLIGMLLLIGGVTLAALSAFKEANAVTYQRQTSLTLMNDVRLEVELLSRLVSSYVSTANPRYLIYYYDILGIREGTKPRPPDQPGAYWDQVLAGLRPYQQPSGGDVLPLIKLAGQLGFDAREQGAVSRILGLAEQMKQVEQIAFAATQGLYDPASKEFVSESEPQREFAAKLLHEADYLRLRADLVEAVEGLAQLVDGRTQRNVDNATEKLESLIMTALALLLAAALLLLLSYRYLTRHLLAPLFALHQAASALAHKSYGERVGNVNGFVEVQTLATTMDGMAAAIEADIEQRQVVQEELALARARAEVAAEAKSIFLANMSHEIRTPMNAILGMAYLALRSDLQPTQRNYVAKIHDAAKSLLGILNDILDYSKIEAGKVVLESESFDLQSVVQNAVFMVQQRAQDKQLELILDYRIAHGSAFVGDSLRLGQVLINLLSNAVKFTERGHVRLVVSDWDNEDGSAVLHFAVEDTGIGMSAEQQGRLFQEFSQADGSTTRKYGGTGLGLSISKRLVEAMGGNIRAKSEVDRGSLFDFAIRLPVAAYVAHDGGKIRRRRALVVDDYAPARESMVELLRLLGCTLVDAAADGPAAIALLEAAQARSQPYDLLLLDWMMPGMGGAAVLETMLDRHLALPEKTIVVSALDVALLRDQAAQLGVGDVLQKPAPPKILCEVANSAVGEDLPLQTNAGAPQKNLDGMRVLVVEDNEINQQVAVEILHAWGVIVDLARDGQQALDLLFKQSPAHYDLVLMDLEMPVLNGSEATRLLRANTRYGGLPVVAMTAHAVGGELQAALAAGMNGHISKPFEPDDLFDVLSRHRRTLAEERLPPSADKALLAESVEDQRVLDHLAQLPGLDARLLYQRFPGRVAFICRMLRRFASEQGKVVAEIESRLAAGDRATAQRLAHSVKGLAGNLAMSDVQVQAANLEDEIKAGAADVAPCLQALDAAIAPLLAGLANLPEAPAPSVASQQPSDIARVVRRLRHCLMEGDGEAEALWLGHQESFASYFSPVVCKRLGRAISAWDFDDALRVLETTGMGGEVQ
ncbi:hybrid sensor histidine kinase/response regulator [Dechloromonas denitrificans]|uniref:hybrid sensor histidine kinase/response regulator n=1 Tax=Dechloromonas denitrificans TaxID=281362 RepID=UPI000ABCCE97|nr:hybrid sensor histidine kinase/response regulator [Dechloromonas denitrificans]